MMMYELTNWYPGIIKPAYIGVYRRNLGPANVDWFSYWDGKLWHQGDSTIEIAYDRRSAGTLCAQDFPWRGLTLNSALELYKD
jgi:hypothetical protein